jgi:2-hydroxy-6-oxonona-2,4-dienedioate hydrolase
MEAQLTVSPPSQAGELRTTFPVRRSSWTSRGEHGDVQASVIDVGRGTPVVFLHGLVGLNEHWEGVVERTCHRTRCILFELPLLSLRGEDCSVHGAMRMTSEFLREYLREPAVLVGNSFGGHVALRIGIEHPELVEALVLAGSSGLIERTMVKEITVRPSREWLVRKIGELFYDQSNMRTADIDRAHRELSDRGGARAMVKLSRSARSDHLGEKIGAIIAPCLIIWGKQDIVTPPEAAEEFMSRLRDARIVWFDRCGHAPMIECPERFAEELLVFAGELARRKTGVS